MYDTYVCMCILTILITVLYKYTKFLYTELYAGCMVGHSGRDTNQHGYHCIDTLVQETHSGRTITISQTTTTTSYYNVIY